MKKLSMKTLKVRDDIYIELQLRFTNLENAVKKYNDAVDNVRDELQYAMNEFNEQVNAANNWAHDDAATEIREYMGERSEKWQESDRGQAFEEWASSYEQFNLEEIELELPEPIDANEVDMPEDPFEELQEEIAY